MLSGDSVSAEMATVAVLMIGFGAGVDSTGKLPVRKIGEAIIDDNPVKGAYRKAFTDNPIVEARAKSKRGRPKGKKNKPKP